MEVFRDLPPRGDGMAGAGTGGAGTAVTIGAFDGVHLGHLAVLRELRRRAEPLGYPTAVVTFDRHPATVVRPQSAPRLLTDLDQRLELLDRTGEVDFTVVIRFDTERSQEEAEDFVAEVLVESLHARLVVVGEDFHFGRGRRGNVALLSGLGGRLGFGVVGLGLLDVGGGPAGPVSSTAIRALLERGDVAGATGMLGRPYEMRGVVRPGDRRGRELGFPTANIAVPPPILLPADGVYAGWYERPDATVHQAAISVGHRPTFHDAASEPVLEAFLLDFDGDLYDERARVRFVSRLRGQERFGSTDELVTQTARDVEIAREVLTG